MRRALSFVFALGLLIAGGYTLFNILLNHLADANVLKGKAIMAGCFMMGLGGYWLWVDFINPESS